MPKFYPHDIELERSVHHAQLEQAKESTSGKTFFRGCPYLAENALLNLIRVSEIGLPDCYDDFTDFLYDFYPGLSWNKEGQTSEIEYILADQRFEQVVSRIKEDWNFDMRNELQEALECDE